MGQLTDALNDAARDVLLIGPVLSEVARVDGGVAIPAIAAAARLPVREGRSLVQRAVWEPDAEVDAVWSRRDMVNGDPPGFFPVGRAQISSGDPYSFDFDEVRFKMRFEFSMPRNAMVVSTVTS
jgi:hypothetical protein